MSVGRPPRGVDLVTLAKVATRVRENPHGPATGHAAALARPVRAARTLMGGTGPRASYSVVRTEEGV
ncbi:hypothetical protein GCM10022416_46210 [Actinomadura keratinilytica]|jgi:hypothetical protein|uniref:Uncharacterized protein n=1 Tax=Actinomadura keratinilytica TaxID=547461 RepID=A0ABP7Z8N0_9ACTN